MTIQEKIQVAEQEVKTAKMMVVSSRENVKTWEQRLEVREETLAALLEEAKPKRKAKS